jgi:hypothetical protein
MAGATPVLANRLNPPEVQRSAHDSGQGPGCAQRHQAWSASEGSGHQMGRSRRVRVLPGPDAGGVGTGRAGGSEPACGERPFDKLRVCPERQPNGAGFSLT